MGLLYNVIDKGLAEQMKELTIEQTENMLEKFNVPEDQIEEQMEKIEKSDFNQSPRALITSWMISVVFGLFLALIASAFTKKMSPSSPMSQALLMNNALNISIVIPQLNEEESLPELTHWIVEVLTRSQLSFEILYIDDGSTDDSWAVIERQTEEYTGLVRGIRFQRNYGKSAALNVGFEATRGEIVFTMDADLQDSPDELPGMYKRMLEEQLDILSGWKKKRYDPLSKTIPTRLFNWATRRVSGVHNLHDFNCGLKAYNARVIKSIEVYGEMHRYIPVIARWAGFRKIEEQVVQHQARKYGHTKFGMDFYESSFSDGHPNQQPAVYYLWPGDYKCGSVLHLLSHQRCRKRGAPTADNVGKIQTAGKWRGVPALCPLVPPLHVGVSRGWDGAC